MTATKTRGPRDGIPTEVLAAVDALCAKHGEGGHPLPRGDVLHGLLLLSARFPAATRDAIESASRVAAARVSEAKRRAAAASHEARRKNRDARK